MNSTKRFLFIIVTIFILVLTGFIYYRFFYAFSEGNRSGILVKFSRRGYVFKTYEGAMVLPGLRSYPASPLIGKEFVFSVSDKRVADSLSMLEGKEMVLYYVEYNGSLPWRGESRYVVKNIRAVKDSN